MLSGREILEDMRRYEPGFDKRNDMDLDEVLACSDVFSIGISKRTRKDGWTCLKFKNGYNALLNGISPWKDTKYTRTGAGLLKNRVLSISEKDVIGWELHVSFTDRSGEYKGSPAGSIKLAFDSLKEMVAVMSKVIEVGKFANKTFPYDRSLYDVRRSGVKLKADRKYDDDKPKVNVNFWSSRRMAEFKETGKRLEKERKAAERAELERRYGMISRRTGLSVELLAEAEDARMAHYGPIAAGSMLAGTS